jgi:hypothetical protein
MSKKIIESLGLDDVKKEIENLTKTIDEAVEAMKAQRQGVY